MMMIERDCWQGVTAPDLSPWLARMSDWYGALQAEVCDLILPYAKEQGAKVFGCVGTCWGGYLVARLSAYSDFRAAVSFHPATTFIAENVNKEKLYEVRPAIYFYRQGTVVWEHYRNF